jgi:hypothetical protein
MWRPGTLRRPEYVPKSGLFLALLKLSTIYGKSPLAAQWSAFAADAPKARLSMVAAQKKTTVRWSFLELSLSGVLDRVNVLGLRAFLAVRHGHGNFLTFVQGFATVAVDGAVVHKYILATFTFYKTPTFFVIEPLDCAFYYV